MFLLWFRLVVIYLGRVIFLLCALSIVQFLVKWYVSEAGCASVFR